MITLSNNYRRYNRSTKNSVINNINNQLVITNKQFTIVQILQEIEYLNQWFINDNDLFSFIIEEFNVCNELIILINRKYLNKSNYLIAKQDSRFIIYQD